MNKKTLFDEGRMKSSKLDWILVGFFSIVAVWSAKVLYWPSSLDSSGTGSFAKIESLSNIVKSKSLGNLAWNDVQVGQTFKRKDLLFTYDKSRAKLILERGEGLELLPNSLIELDQFSGGLAIQVKEGLIYLDIKEGEAVKVNLGGKEISLSSKSAKVKLSTSNGISKLESSNGDVSVQSSTGETFELDQNNQIEVNESNEFKLSEKLIKLVNPKDSENIFIEEDEIKIDYQWEFTDKSYDISPTIQISQSSAFESSTLIEEDDDIGVGTYFWRAVNEEGIVLSSTFTFETKKEEKVEEIIQQPELELLTPLNLAEVNVSRPGEIIEFVFSGEAKIEISKDQKFENIVVSSNARNSFSWPVKTLGQFFWRIQKDSLYSEVREINIKPGDILPAPDLERAPSELKLVPLKPQSFIGNLISNAYAQDFSAEFEWNEVDGAQAYIIEIFADQNQTKLLNRQVVNDNNFLWIGAPLRQVWWRVKAIDQWQREGLPSSLVQTALIPPSGWEETEIELDSPRHRSEFEQNKIVEFEWNSKPGVKNWIFLLSEDLNFKNPILSKKITSNEIELNNLPVGEWYWRIKAIDSLGRELLSKRRKIVITKLDKVEVAKEEIRVNEYKLRLNLRSPFDIDIGLQATKPSYELKRGRQDFNLTGMTASGFNLNLSRELSSYRLFSNLSWVSGKAFDSLSYQDNSLNIGVQKSYDLNLSFPVWVGAGISFNRLSSYERAANSNTLSDSTISTFSLHSSLLAQPFVWDNKYIETQFDLSVLGQMAFGLHAKYFIGKWFYGVGFKNQTIEKEGDYSVTTLMLHFGYRWQR